MKIWTITTETDGSGLATLVAISQEKADLLALGTVNGWWREAMDGFDPPDIGWKTIYAMLCEESGFLNTLEVKEHEISALIDRLHGETA